MKKVLTLIALSALVSLSACGKKKEEAKAEATPKAKPVPPVTKEECEKAYENIAELKAQATSASKRALMFNMKGPIATCEAANSRPMVKCLSEMKAYDEAKLKECEALYKQ